VNGRIVPSVSWSSPLIGSCEMSSSIVTRGGSVLVMRRLCVWLWLLATG
jgi:hypothetical protein